HLVAPDTKLGRLVGGDDRVVVHDAEDRFRRVLQRHPVLHRSEVVADVELTGGLDTAEDACHAPNVMSASDASQGMENSVGAPRGLVFVADPLDGTTNFLHGLPWYAVTIAALVDGELQAGATINVATGELFTATRGGGARRAGAPIRVSDVTDPARALIATG